MIATLRYTLGEIGDSDVDAVLLPGDLFHSRDLRPKNLDRVEDALRECVPNDVRVLVSRGNHDENLSPRDVTWLSYLHRRGHIVLLEADLGGDAAAGFDPFNPDERGEHAGFVDLPAADADGPVRVFGLQWRGARTPNALERVADGIRVTNDQHGEPAYTVLLGHFGMEDEVPALGGTITHADLHDVREVVDYFALGHIHKRYEAAGWIHNPGSPEAHDTQEGRDDWGHGYYLVDLEPDADADGPGMLTHDPTHHAAKRRAYHPIEFDVTPYDSPGDLETAFHEHVNEERDAIKTRCEREIHIGSGGSRRPPLIDLRFTGTLQFSRSDLRTGDLSAWAEEACDALYVQTTVGVRTADVEALLSELEDDGAFVDGRLDTSVLERQVFETIAIESEYGDRADDVADVLERAHTMAQADETPADVAETMSERRRELFPEMGNDVTIDVPENPLADETDDGDTATVNETAATDADTTETVTTDTDATETAASDATTTAGLGEFAGPEGGDAE